MAGFGARARSVGERLRAVPWLGVLNLLVSVISAPVAIGYWLAPTESAPGWALAAQIWLLLCLTGLVIGAGLLYRSSRASAASAVSKIDTLEDDLRTERAESSRRQGEVEYLHLSLGRFADALELYHDAFHDLRYASNVLIECALAGDVPTAMQEQWVRAFEKSLRGLAEFYTRDTGQQCHVVVKQLVPPKDAGPNIRLTQDNAMVLAIARSHPGAPATAERRIKLSDNSDYLDVLQDAETRYFFSNDLDNHPGYRNPTRGNRYNSAIVWPIAGPRPGLEDTERSETTSKMSLALGFLSVDAPSSGAFGDPIHAWLGASLADTLFAVLSTRMALKASRPAPAADQGEPQLGAFGGVR